MHRWAGECFANCCSLSPRCFRNVIGVDFSLKIGEEFSNGLGNIWDAETRRSRGGMGE